jgi:hypothetical protein
VLPHLLIVVSLHYGCVCMRGHEPSLVMCKGSHQCPGDIEQHSTSYRDPIRVAFALWVHITTCLTSCLSLPVQMTRLSGRGTAIVACGHSYTAAVMHDGGLWVWGTGLGGQLGLGPSALTTVWPTRVSAALSSVRCVAAAAAFNNVMLLVSSACLWSASSSCCHC